MRGIWFTICNKCGRVLEWHQPKRGWLDVLTCPVCGGSQHTATPAEEKAIALLPKDQNGHCRLERVMEAANDN